MRTAEKAVLEAVLTALKSKRKRRTAEEIAADAAKPKRPISDKQKHWNAFVSQVHAEMKEEDPKAKRTDAMKKAKELRDKGLMPVAPEGDDSDSESEAESFTSDVVERIVKPSKKEKSPKKEPKKKAPKKAAPPESDSDSEDEPAPVKPKKAPKAPSSPKSKPAPPPPADDSDDEEAGEALKSAVIGNKKVLISSLGECWEQTDSGAMGKWLGLFDEKSKKIKPAPEPELE